MTDVGSTKASVIAQMQSHMPEHVHFIPGHPIAGTEHSGPDAGFAGLFVGRWCILTPVPGTDPDAVAKLRDFWNALGSKVEEMDPLHHDKVLAIVSHLPHIIAYNIVGTADDLETVTESEVINTRLPASATSRVWLPPTRPCGGMSAAQQGCDPGNAGALLGRSRYLQRAIRWGDGDKLFDLFTRTRAIRRSIIEAGQDTAAPNFGRNGASLEVKAGE